MEYGWWDSLPGKLLDREISLAPEQTHIYTSHSRQAYKGVPQMNGFGNMELYTFIFIIRMLLSGLEVA